MLHELMVENYAVVEHARIRFGEGLNVLTGETGSGKSIVVDSFGLLLGARASTDVIRSGEERARVTGIFNVELLSQVTELLAGSGIELAPDEELIIEREIAANGKSRAFVSNRPVTTAFLRQLAPALGDIHGQNEQQNLFAPQAQRALLDDYAGTGDLRSAVARYFAQWRDTGEKLEELSRSEQEKIQLLDLWSFQRKEIDAEQPRAGEDLELAAERKILQNMTRLQESAAAAFSALYEAPDSATTQIRQVVKRLDELTRIDTSLKETAESVQQTALLLDEAAYTLRDYLGRLESDPARLDKVESRLAALDRLKRKYGNTLEEVIAFRDDVAERIDLVENASQRRASLEKERDELARRYEELALKLSGARIAAAHVLSRAVEDELKGLAMSGTQFRIRVSQGNWSVTGVDEIGFLVSPNRGEELKPFEKVASGGELSRLALALKTTIGARPQAGVPTLVFDEVDAGVGGAAAAAVGRRLKSLSQSSQVICVTHLAQIAGFADHHYAVSKREKKGRITTAIEELLRGDRTREIGRMLSGEQVTAEALRQAEQLIQAGANR